MSLKLEDQLESAIERVREAEDSLLLTWSESAQTAWPGRVTQREPDAQELSQLSNKFDLVVLVMSRELDALAKIEVPLLIAAVMKPGAILLQSAHRGTHLEFPLIRTKLTIPPGASDLMLSTYRKAP